MTREEIINGLKMSMDLTLFDPSTGEVMEPRQLNDINRTAYEAYKGAIELLEKQPDTTTYDSIPAETGKNDGDGTSGDCISRWTALETIRTMQTYKLFEGDDMILIDKAQVQTELMMLPSVQPKHGEWKYHSNPNIGINPETAYCSCCGLRVDTTGDIDFDEYNFCPRCGTDMRGEQDG